MSRNLLKAGWVTLNEDTRVINSNDLLEQCLEREADRLAQMNAGETSQEEGFSEGIGTENVDALLDADSDSAIVKSISRQEQEKLDREISAAREELERLQEEASQVMAHAEAEALAMKEQAYEEARRRGYQEGYSQGMTEFEAKKRQCDDKIAAVKEEYQKKIDELEPQMVETLSAIYEHVFRVDLRKHENLVHHLLIDALLQMDSARNIMIHVSREDYDFLQEHKAAILEETGMVGNAVEFVSDATLAKAQCMIETDHGIYDCSLDTELEELKRRLSLLAFQG